MYQVYYCHIWDFGEKLLKECESLEEAKRKAEDFSDHMYKAWVEKDEIRIW
ncbi:hypothetical protein [Priestia flexa]|uniref:hypothetical protein n=1 Tax=Priestia flexa TaxID=86664 RepID=UPI000AF522EA|nr:hypothetical protein [Priestia flexa]